MKRLRILIVDDDTMIANLLAELLVGDGHLVCGIETTEAGAVRAAEREGPDLVIIDGALDGGSGIHAMELIHRTGPVAHLFISGSRMPTGYPALQKPFRPAQLWQAIGSALAAVSTVER